MADGAKEPSLQELKALKLAEQEEVRARFARGELSDAEKAGLFAGMPKPKLVGKPTW